MSQNETPSKAKLFKALAAASHECNNPRKNATNPHLKNQFADLKEILATVKPVLERNGLGLVQLVGGEAGTHKEFVKASEKSVETSAGLVELRTIIFHAESGESIESTQRIKAHQPGTNDAQSAGIAITYLRRYAILAMLGIVGDADGDGSEYDWNAPKAPPALLAAAEEAARKKDGFGPFWKSISKEERQLLQPEIERLKGIAESAK